jgi:ABC-type antimicrobial peptide transport system permease subunit
MLHADASVSAALIQASVRAIDPGIAVHELKTMDALVASNLTGRRSAQIMLTTFALCALLMTAVGLYGTLALAVTSRKREFGVRLAIGADGRGLRRMMLLRALRIAAVGVGFGLLAAVGFMTVLSSLVADVRPDDLPAYLQALALVLTTAFIASLLPAHRASRTDPTQCLRSE